MSEESFSATENMTASQKVHGPLAENVETFVMAIIMAVLLKYFIVEAYKIPTGSMQPTLIGDAHSKIQDRILVDKLSYKFHAPKRWEVSVFRYPLDRSKTFVKRIAGVGPEELKIQYGDVWNRQPGEPWKILRRPRDVQESVWKRLDDHPDHGGPFWEGLVGEWDIAGRDLAVKGNGTAQFKTNSPSVIDSYLHGYPPSVARHLSGAGKGGGSNPVGDLRLEGRLKAKAETRSVQVVLKEGQRRYRFSLPGPKASDDARPRIEINGAKDSSATLDAPWRLASDADTPFAVQNMDDLLQLEIDGEIVLTLEIDPAVIQSSGVFLEVEGEGAALSDARVYRDIYYTPSGSRSVSIPEGQYFMLGDNTQESSDSREWRYSILDLDEEVWPVGSVRGNLRRGENPRVVGVGDPNGPKTHFIDEWGEPHWFGNDEIQARRTESSPFVPKEMILGKAVAVFWPLDPRRAIFRPRWVN